MASSLLEMLESEQTTSSQWPEHRLLRRPEDGEEDLLAPHSHSPLIWIAWLALQSWLQAAAYSTTEVKFVADEK